MERDTIRPDEHTLEGPLKEFIQVGGIVYRAPEFGHKSEDYLYVTTLTTLQCYVGEVDLPVDKLVYCRRLHQWGLLST